MGAIFGLVGLFVAACLYLAYALAGLVFMLAGFAARLIIFISAMIAKLILYAYHRYRAQHATPAPTPPTNKRVPAGLKPTRVARKGKVKP